MKKNQIFLKTLKWCHLPILFLILNLHCNSWGLYDKLHNVNNNTGGSSGGSKCAAPPYLGSTNTTAKRVYGQFGSFTSAVQNNDGTGVIWTATADNLNGPNGVVSDYNGVYVVDSGNNRVLYYSGSSTTATRVYGHLGNILTCGVANDGGGCVTGGTPTVDSLFSPTGVAIDSTGVYIADNGNHRVLYYSGTSTTATRVYGQSGDFTCGVVNRGPGTGPGTCGSAAVSADSLSSPVWVAIDSTGVYIADSNNNRVLYYPGTSTTASRVYGQFGNPNCNAANVKDNTCTLAGITSNQSLSGPGGVAVDSTGVYIADTGNVRVLYYPGTSTTATRVYGQFGSFTSAVSNHNGLGVSGNPSANNLGGIYIVALDCSGVYITDAQNSRVLYYPGTSTTASRVYGQSGSFTCGVAYNDGTCTNVATPTADNLGASIGPGMTTFLGIHIGPAGVYISESLNQRVLVY